MDNFGLYVHIPFCAKKCAYCDFLSSPSDDGEKARYVDALCKEISDKAKLYGRRKVTTVYVGGGTPSHLDARLAARIFGCINDNFTAEITEFTVECNPESVTVEKLSLYKEYGVNRVSVGVQSLNDDVLKSIGRIHNGETAVKAVETAVSLFENVSADLMLGLPSQTEDDVIYAAETLVGAGVKHISAYGLILEENTPLYNSVRNGELTVDDDAAADFYDAIVNFLYSRGFYRYEVSNFAVRGYESRHNFSYWNRNDYLGLGAGAHSFIDGVRFNNVCDVSEYIEAVNRGLPVERNAVKLDVGDEKFETIMLALRTGRGLDVNAFDERFATDFTSEYGKELEKVGKYVEMSNGFLKIKPDCFYIMNTVLTEFLK